MTEIEKLTAGHPDTQSADTVAGNIEALRALFPEAFAEGKIDFAALKQCLGGAVDEREEKYGLNWHGKRRARQIALTPSTGTLLPCPASWSARLRPYSISLCRLRCPIFSFPRSRFSVASVAALARVGVVSLRRTYRLYEGQTGHRKCAGGPRTIGWAAAPDRPGSRLGAPISGRRHGAGTSRSRSGPSV